MSSVMKLLVVVLGFLFHMDNIFVSTVRIDELKCSFEDGFCSVWTAEPSVWTRYEYAHNDNPSTGPDGPKDGGFYIHTSKKKNQSESDYALLTSEPITNNLNGGTTCFRFWYNMNGDHITNLTVLLNNTAIFSKHGNQGKEWLCGAIDVTDFQGEIIFKAGRSIEPFSVIALDSFQVLPAADCSSCTTIQETSAASSSSTTSSTTSSSTLITTNNALDATDPGGGVTDQLPIAIGVPAGVLIVGVIIVTVCIFKRRASDDETNNVNRRSTSSNQYTGSPRNTVIYGEDEEVYMVLNEEEMIDGGVDNGGYIDPTPDYAEPDEVDIKRNGHVGYKTTAEETLTDHVYITPISDYESPHNRNLRHSKDDYTNSLVASNSPSHLNDYLEPQAFTDDGHM